MYVCTYVYRFTFEYWDPGARRTGSAKSCVMPQPELAGAGTAQARKWMETMKPVPGIPRGPRDLRNKYFAQSIFRTPYTERQSPRSIGTWTPRDRNQISSPNPVSKPEHDDRSSAKHRTGLNI